MADLVPCSRCKQDVAVSQFGRCCICGDVISETALKYRPSCFGFSKIYAAIGMAIGVGGSAICVLTLSLLGSYFTLPLVGAA